MKPSTITKVLLATALAACTVGCKKKEGDASGPPAPGGTTASPKSAEPASTGIPECDTYLHAMAKFASCDKLPAELKQLYGGDLDKQRDEYAHAKDKAATAADCKKAMDDLVAGAKYRGCPLE